ncbi:MAG TPA: DUF4097 family beta strand repeat-containing protein [Gemmatimonadaceae bacterium]|nr:DUF4097 family beta strand repeat-containing protein [Gemmatimonadaceae bacterium]
MRYRPHLALLAALLAAAPLGAQGRTASGDIEEQSQLDTTLTLERSGTVELELVSGEIRVTSWNRDQVRISASSERGLLDLDASPSHVGLSVHSRHGHLGDTRFEVTVPATARLLLHTVSGDISSRGGAEVEARSVSGDVNVSNVTGRTTLGSVSGEVSGKTIGGNVRAKTVSGDLTLNSVTGDVEAETVSGDMELTGIRSTFVHANSTSGDEHFEGALDPKGRYDFRSYSGDVRLAIPAGTGAQASIETFSGDLDSDFPVTLLPGSEQSRSRPRQMQFKIGSGGAVLSATTFSGDVIIERGSGRQED